MSKETILVVDDNVQISDLLARQLLPDMGFAAFVAPNGKKALEILRSQQFSLALLDLQLPDMSGLEILRRLSAEGISLPIILFTAHGSEQVAAEAFRLGVQDYLTKPVDAESLEFAITRALQETRLRQEKERLSRQLQEQVARLTVLARVGRSVTSTLELDEVLRRIVEAGVSLTQAEEGFLALLDETSGQLYLRAAKNIDQDRVKTMRLPVNDSLIGSVISTGQPIRSIQTGAEPPIKLSTGYLVQSLLYVPLLSRGKAFGVLSVDNQVSRRAFTQLDENLLTSLADYAAVALENARLYEQARQEISMRRRTELALRASEERYILAMRGANDGLWDWDLKTNQVYFSPRWKAMLGFSEHELENRWEEWLKRIHPDDVEQVKLDLAAHMRGITPQFDNEHRILHKDGAYRWMLSRGVAVKDKDDRVYRIAGSLTDINDRKYAEEMLLRDAFFDTLTNLPNRALFMDRLRYSVERSRRRNDYRFSVLFLDLDRFKDVNDGLGHMIGDQLLVAIADVLRAGLRATDTVARFGGDEFVILLEDITEYKDALRVAEWIHKKLSQSFELNGHNVFITTSIGIVLSSDGYERPEDLIRDADIAMYSAKANGKARHEIFDPSMRTRIMDRLALEAELRQALERNELRVYYQPIVSLTTGEMTGLEALVRWNHPVRGLLMPSAFLPLAEETGLIIQIDHWVLREACRQVRAWKDHISSAHSLSISVNFSGKQINQPDLVEVVLSIIEETGLDPRCLKLEMTENSIMENSEQTIEVFSRLRSAGIQVQVDDFGVGYSSLNYLSHFPVDALKIDQNFVSIMQEDNNQLKIVQAILILTERLGVGAIAEGIETYAQLAQLKSLGCQFGQGYLVSMPLEPGSVSQLLESLVKDPDALHYSEKN